MIILLIHPNIYPDSFFLYSSTEYWWIDCVCFGVNKENRECLGIELTEKGLEESLCCEIRLKEKKSDWLFFFSFFNFFSPLRPLKSATKFPVVVFLFFFLLLRFYFFVMDKNVSYWALIMPILMEADGIWSYL